MESTQSSITKQSEEQGAIESQFPTMKEQGTKVVHPATEEQELPTRQDSIKGVISTIDPRKGTTSSTEQNSASNMEVLPEVRGDTESAGKKNFEITQIETSPKKSDLLIHHLSYQEPNPQSGPDISIPIQPNSSVHTSKPATLGLNDEMEAGAEEEVILPWDPRYGPKKIKFARSSSFQNALSSYSPITENQEPPMGKYGVNVEVLVESWEGRGVAYNALLSAATSIQEAAILEQKEYITLQKAYNNAVEEYRKIQTLLREANDEVDQFDANKREAEIQKTDNANVFRNIFLDITAAFEIAKHKLNGTPRPQFTVAFGDGSSHTIAPADGLFGGAAKELAICQEDVLARLQDYCRALSSGTAPAIPTVEEDVILRANSFCQSHPETPTIECFRESYKQWAVENPDKLREYANSQSKMLQFEDLSAVLPGGSAKKDPEAGKELDVAAPATSKATSQNTATTNSEGGIPNTVGREKRKKTASQKLYTSRRNPRGVSGLILQETQAQIARALNSDIGLRLYNTHKIIAPRAALIDPKECAKYAGEMAQLCKTNHSTGLGCIRHKGAGGCAECGKSNWIDLDIYLPPNTKILFLLPGYTVNAKGCIVPPEGKDPLDEQAADINGIPLLGNLEIWKRGEEFTAPLRIDIPESKDDGEYDRYAPYYLKRNRTTYHDHIPIRFGFKSRVFTPSQKTLKQAKLKDATNDEEKDLELLTKFHMKRFTEAFDMNALEPLHRIRKHDIEKNVKGILKAIVQGRKQSPPDIPASAFDITKDWLTLEDVEMWSRAASLALLRRDLCIGLNKKPKEDDDEDDEDDDTLDGLGTPAASRSHSGKTIKVTEPRKLARAVPRNDAKKSAPALTTLPKHQKAAAIPPSGALYPPQGPSGMTPSSLNGSFSVPIKREINQDDQLPRNKRQRLSPPSSVYSNERTNEQSNTEPKNTDNVDMDSTDGLPNNHNSSHWEFITSETNLRQGG